MKSTSLVIDNIDHNTKMKFNIFSLIRLAGCLLLLTPSAAGQCPWHRDVIELQSACICAYNMAQQLSVQCDNIDFPKLLEVLEKYAASTTIDLLYVNNSTLHTLKNNSFEKLTMHDVQLSGCKIRNIEPDAFHGQENSLRNLNLQENELTEVPTVALKNMKTLRLLDLSKNKIEKIPDGAFERLTLSTLKVSDNSITLSPFAFRGLEKSLKNLNLKGTRQRKIPTAVRDLKELAFLDLAQNGLRNISDEAGEILESLSSLSALNLERNLIQSIAPKAFVGVGKSLSSLSLLNNLLTEYPTPALTPLFELRVLDMGFNLLTDVPKNAFIGNPSLTLLALDGNPLATLSEDTIAHLKETLKGLSLGGRFLHCDCKIRWLVELVRKGDLQVMSREKNPQFCGSPAHLKDRSFYTIDPKELVCPKEEVPVEKGVPIIEKATLDDAIRPMTHPHKKPDYRKGAPLSEFEAYTHPVLNGQISIKDILKSSWENTAGKTTTTTTPRPTQTSTPHPATTKPTTQVHRQNPSWGNAQRPPLVLAYPAGKRTVVGNKEIVLKKAVRENDSIIVQWESDKSNILGFRILYRLFGEKTFKQGPPLDASEREFKIQNLPPDECVIVCVVSLDETNVTPETVPPSQCQEVKTDSLSFTFEEKLTIYGSSIITITIFTIIMILLVGGKRRQRQLEIAQPNRNIEPPNKDIVPVPMQNCARIANPNPGPNVSPIRALNPPRDWDQVSTYSNRSIPRPQIYTIEYGSPNARRPADDLHSNVSHASHVGPALLDVNSQGHRPERSVADGQSQHSFSNQSARHHGGSNAFVANLAQPRPDLRQSRQSLASMTDRHSRISCPVPHVHCQPPSRIGYNSQQRNEGGITRPGSRYSTVGSTHTLNNYCDTPENWTDHDVNIYTTRNPTTRPGHVPR